MPPVVIEKSFCTTREAATLLGVSVGTVQLWVESDLLQAWKTAGGHRRVLRDSVDSLLRRAPDQPAVPPPNTWPVSKPRQFKVLVVEDDADLLRLYQVNLSRWPMQPNVTCLDNAVAALLMMGRGGPDLLITDLHMPGMDGFEMLRVLRLAPEMAHTTIVVVTGLDAEAIAEQGGLPDGIEVLCKPIPFDRLQALATGIVNTSNFQRSSA
ncbi:MAG: response regulator [Rhodoferax sp.]